MGQREFIVLISMLMALTALAIDLMLPAFGAMRESFGLAEGSSAVAPVVTVFLLGLGVGQPLWGPLSDAVGRKRILWIGLLIYGVAAAGAALAPSLALLLAWRFLGGLGAGAVRVVALGTVRDRSRGEAMARIMSYVMAVFILVPVVAPALGSIILGVASWHATFWVLVACALATATWSLRLPESLPVELRIPPHPGRLVAAVRAVLSSRFAMGLTIAQTDHLRPLRLVPGDQRAVHRRRLRPLRLVPHHLRRERAGHGRRHARQPAHAGSLGSAPLAAPCADGVPGRHAAAGRHRARHRRAAALLAVPASVCSRSCWPRAS